MMYIRKQNRFTEKQIYPYISLEDFRLDLLPRIRKMATNNIEGVHSIVVQLSRQKSKTFIMNG